MPNPGSYTFWNNLTIDWSYDSTKHELTVSGTLNGKSIGSDVLSPGNHTGTLQGSGGGQSAVVQLDATFSGMTLQLSAQETNPAKAGMHTVDF